MEEISLNSEGTTSQNGNTENNPSEVRKEFVVPAVGMEFECYDDAYNYYNCYAGEAGFSVRVKNSWFKRNSREKYGAVLCCSSQGFKRVKDVNRLRKETRTGCPAMMRMRLADSKRWRILEVTIEHNHLLGGEVHKGISGIKRKSLSNSYTLVIDAGGSDVASNFNQKNDKNTPDETNQLNLRKGDSQAMYNYFCRMQLTNPNFFYSMDLNDEGRLRNVFWVDARSRAMNAYFGDVIFIDTTCLSNKYEVPLVSFVGINHHGQSVLLGCGLISSEVFHSYVWLFKAWHISNSGHSPKTVITDRCKVLQSAVADVFPNSQHKFCLPLVLRKIPEKLGGLPSYDAVKKALLKSVYGPLKSFDFEAAWGFMIQRFGVVDNEWLRSLYEDRALWAPVYLKESFFVGMYTTRPAFFDKHLHKQTQLKEFLDKYELVLQRKHKEEAVADLESRETGPELKTRCSFELQLSKIYTREIFRKFQAEVEEMYSCFSTTQIHVDGPVAIFLVKERVLQELREGNCREIKDFEVLYNRSAAEVRCICSCFNFYGYLCRHALCVLNFNGVEEIPAKYILSRWKKDYKWVCVQDERGGGFEGCERAKGFDQLWRSALQVVEEGVVSLDHYKVALEAFEEALERVHSMEETSVLSSSVIT